jgi:subtilisin family serine protease
MRQHSLVVALVLSAGALPAGALAQNQNAPRAGAHGRAVAALRANPGLDRNPTSIIVRFDERTTEAMRAGVRAAIGGRKARDLGGVAGLELVESALPVEHALAGARAMPGVVYAEPDYVVHTTATPNDPYFSNLWGMNNSGQSVNGDPGTGNDDIDAPEAWNTFTGDPNLVVAVIDTGVQWTHADLAANIWTNPGEVAGNGVDDDGDGYVDDVHGYDWYGLDSDPNDETGHGTHVAGTIGAVGNNGVGVTGVNWRCRIMPLRFIGPNGGYTSDAVSAIQYAVAHGAKVMNASWGGGGYSQALYDAINQARSAGVLFVAAAGNASANNDATPFYPANYALDNVISVAAVDNDFGLASFSNYGATAVHLGAPGVNILSTYYGDQYAWMSGTSMAAPHVTGVAALVIGQNPAWTYAQVRSRLFSTVRADAALSGRTVTGGVVNAAAALASTPPPPPPTIPAMPGTPSATNLGGGRAQVSWADNSSNESAFEVQRQKKNHNKWSGGSTVGTTGANQNSFVDSPGAGTYRYRVRATNSAGASAWTAWGSQVSIN